MREPNSLPLNTYEEEMLTGVVVATVIEYVIVYGPDNFPNSLLIYGSFRNLPPLEPLNFRGNDDADIPSELMSRRLEDERLSRPTSIVRNREVVALKFRKILYVALNFAIYFIVGKYVVRRASVFNF